MFLYHDAFNPNTATVEDLKERYRTGKVSDREVKERLIAALNAFLDPVRERRARYAARPDDVRDALLSGTQRCKRIAEQTMREVREAMRIMYV